MGVAAGASSGLAIAVWRRWGLNRFCVALSNRRSELTAERPRARVLLAAQRARVLRSESESGSTKHASPVIRTPPPMRLRGSSARTCLTRPATWATTCHGNPCARSCYSDQAVRAPGQNRCCPRACRRHVWRPLARQSVRVGRCGVERLVPASGIRGGQRVRRRRRLTVVDTRTGAFGSCSAPSRI